jgi:nucleotide sugar dehydrogenase
MNGVRIGCIGQGWIGKNYADDFERRGYDVIRYALEEPYVGNKDAIAACDIVFIAVPTPTTKEGFDASYIRSVLPLVGAGKIAVVKSTILPGTTEALQAAFPDIIVLHSPEFLRETTAAHDAANPERNIVGIPRDDPSMQDAARAVLAVLPPAPFTRVMSARQAELVKYAGNVFLAMKVVYANLLYDLAAALDAEYGEVAEALGADPRIGTSHLNPIAASGHASNPGRGAGGHCFIKDFEAFRLLYESKAADAAGLAFLNALARKNNELLITSGKDLELVRLVYGDRHELLP